MRSFFALAALSAFVSLAACSTTAEDLTGNLKLDFAVKGNLMTKESYAKIAEATGGLTYESRGSSDMASLVGTAMTASLPDQPKVDIVFCVDTTGSMGDDIDAVKEKLSDLIDALAADHPDWQIGVATYRDREDDYITKTVQPLTHDKQLAQEGVAALKAEGGGDYREHVYAGLDTALRDQPWREGAAHRILLIGDAPPHESYKDDARSFASTTELAKEKQVQINTIGAHCDQTCQVLVSALDGIGGGAE